MRRSFLLLFVVAFAAVGCFKGGGFGGGGGPAPELEVMQKPNGKSYDLIPTIDPKTDTVGGEWVALANGELRCNSGGGVPRIHVPYVPPQEYDFIVVFSQPKLRNGISLIMPKPDGNQFFWAIGFGNGTEYGLQGANKNGKIPELIKPNTKYQTVVQVRRDGVKCCINGRVLTDHRTNLADLQSDGWRDMPNKKVLGVACDDPTTFHVIRITEVTGAGTRIR